MSLADIRVLYDRRSILLGGVICSFLGFVICAFLLFQSMKAQSESAENRYHMNLLADELRQSSDDLTRLVRSFVVAGEKRFIDQFRATLAIRNGERPRPDNYHRIYWDFHALDDELPDQSGVKRSLRERMLDRGISAEELALLRLAQERSDSLVNLENVAMRAVQNQLTAADVSFRKPGENNREMALRLVHGDEYHKAKKAIMEPINVFLSKVDNRTDLDYQAEVFASKTLMLFTLVFLLLTAVFGTFTLVVGRRIYKDREKTIRKALWELEESNEAKMSFLANMSHELRTPLNAIIGFSDMIRTEIFGPIKIDKYTGYANDIYNSGNHLLGIINSILDMSKIEAGKHQLNIESMSFGHVLEEALLFVRGRAEDEGITLDNNVDSQWIYVNIDRQATRQILTNLLTNAVKFTPPGGTVSISAETDDRKLRITVSDTGIGMDDEDLKKALEPFVQVDREKGGRQEGTGLGLPLTKKLIDMQNGDFEIRSETGVGTSVIFTVPLMTSELEDEDVSSIETVSWLPSMSIGIREWDSDHRELLELIKRLSETVAGGGGANDPGTVMDALMKYAEVHLSSEEKVMQDLLYPGFKEHKEHHDHFRGWIQDQSDLLDEKPDQWNSEKVSKYLVNWWYNHILKVDMAYKSFFEKHRQDAALKLGSYKGVNPSKQKVER